MAINTQEELQFALDDDLGWRRRELAELRRRSSTAGLSSVCRASVPIAYAHYEGFSKHALVAFGKYITKRGIPATQLKPAMVGPKLKAFIDTAYKTRHPSAIADVAEAFARAGTERVKVDLKPYMENIGNLDHRALLGALRCVGIDVEAFRGLQPFLDDDLLNRRNRIAHGENLTISVSDAVEIIDQVLTIVEQLKSAVENAAARQSYRRTTSTLLQVTA